MREVGLSPGATLLCQPVKIFISHSADEEWLVKLIAPELEKLGVVVYHYEKQAGSDASPIEFAVTEVQQAIQNPFKTAELADRAREIVASAPAPAKPAAPPEPPPGPE